MPKKKNSSKSSKGKSGNTKQISPAKHWFLTLNNYTKEAIQYFCSDSSIVRYCFQKEVCPTTGTPHLQGHFEFQYKIRPVGYFKDTPCIGGHWEKTQNRKAAIVYCSKLDTREGNTYIKNFPKNLFRKVKVLKEEELYEWQKKVIEICKEVPDDRTIHWIWDEDGNKGKSALVKYLVVKHHGMIVTGRSGDIKYQIANADLPPDIILFDVTRARRGHVNYNALEEIKNGLFSSTKYESKMVLIPSPHIFCFANFEPRLELMSMDRWKVTKLE